ncbi:F-box-like domain protein [Rhizoctonia solani AG-3 Rhs1AP]|uniref:F-box-like domain protein n=2 Tax=Rhizoctonia solani AG-3 TaxID=1086053 RepID=A0A074RPB1_9AGAM|nr:F-box-like domain protein [Rhizoctonia solani AG-3 Rhs1AP]KEP48906.1 F-box-like domain protein [Rhizoctonia solani 123E]
MLRELRNAREHLEQALDRYSNACTVVRNHAQSPQFSHSQEHSARMEGELARIINCENKINHAKKCISQAINHSPFVARINSLPDEILARIFHIAIGLQPCFTHLNDPDLEFDYKSFACAQVPERLSHVCCHWRRLAFSLPTLWQHIDIHADAPDVLGRANARMSRVGRLPLDLHIIGFLFEVEELKQWLVSAAPRMKSLTVILYDLFDTLESVLATCFRHCSPTTFSHLTIWKETETKPDHNLVLSLTSPVVPDNVEFDDVFRQLESLRIRQIHPYWGSQAYHGLSELHLASHRSSHSEPLEITIPRLVGILQASPKLRVLRLDLKVTEGQQGAEESSIPDLQQFEVILPLLAPGTKPLQLTLDDLDEDYDLLLQDTVQNFFKRSNVARLKLIFPELDYKELDFDLLSLLAPQLRVFILDHYSWEEYLGEIEVPYARFHERDNSAPNSQLDYLYLHRCRVDLKPCSKLLGDLTHSPRVLVFWKCIFLEDGERMFDEEEIREAFQNVSKDVRILKWDTPKPPDDWFSDSMPRIY